MDEAYKKQATEWFERGQHDLETTQLILNHSGHTDTAAYHVHQAVEKYLKGYLMLYGKKPPRIHELDTILNLIIDFDEVDSIGSSGIGALLLTHKEYTSRGIKFKIINLNKEITALFKIIKLDKLFNINT